MYKSRILSVLVVCMATANLIAAQNLSDDGGAGNLFKQRRASALAAIRANDLDRAERELRSNSPNDAAEDPEALAELAQNLLGLAYEARGAGDLAAAQRAARRALDVAEGASKRFAKYPDRLAEIQLLRASLIEEFLGTTDDAASAIEEAVRLNPSNDEARRRSAKLRDKQKNATSTSP